MDRLHKATSLYKAMTQYARVLRCMIPYVHPLLATQYIVRKHSWVRISFLTAKYYGATSSFISPVRGHKHFKRNYIVCPTVLAYYPLYYVYHDIR